MSLEKTNDISIEPILKPFGVTYDPKKDIITIPTEERTASCPAHHDSINLIRFVKTTQLTLAGELNTPEDIQKSLLG